MSHEVLSYEAPPFGPIQSDIAMAGYVLCYIAGKNCISLGQPT